MSEVTKRIGEGTTPPWFEVTKEIRSLLGAARLHFVQLEAIRLVQCWSQVPELYRSRSQVFGDNWRESLTTWEMRLGELLARQLLPKLGEYIWHPRTLRWVPRSEYKEEKEEKADGDGQRDPAGGVEPGNEAPEAEGQEG